MNNTVHRATKETSETDTKPNEQNQLSVSSGRKRGRPKKINPSHQNALKISTNNNVSREVSDTTTEMITRGKRNTNKIMINTDINNLSDESDITEDKSFIERDYPKNHERKRGYDQRRSRGRGRGHRKTLQSLDKEYIPKTMKKDTFQSKTVKNNKFNLDDMTNIRNTKVTSDTGHTEITPDVKTDIQLVTCARCNQQIPKKQWSTHVLYRHNNMAWQENEEPLDFENDIKLLRKVLTAAVKKKKSLTCEKCSAIKRSANGFISHMQFCGKSEEERQALMMTCPICHAIMMPSSMEMHERYHRQLERNKDKIKEKSVIQTGKAKRKAAEKAIPKILQFAESIKERPCTIKKVRHHSILKDIIKEPEVKKKIPNVWKGLWKKELISKGIISCKQIGCTYTCSSYESICQHYSQCNFIPQENFMCKICKFSADFKEAIIKHIIEFHQSQEDLDQKDLEKYFDFEKDEENSSDESIIESDLKRKYCSSETETDSDNDKGTCRIAFLDKEAAQDPLSTEPYKPTLRWAMEFELKNYELELFKNYMPNIFTLLKNDDAAEYLPELTSSMAFKNINVNSSIKKENSDNDNWKHMNRFEGGIYEDVPTFFVGGPIWALAWLPIPSSMYIKNPTQYIAISTHPSMESEYIVGKNYSESNIIQIWNVGPLNHECDGINKTPVLAYAIAHNNGTIWCLEWCPSGCYQDIDLYNYKPEENKLRRMGLLAAACSDGCVNIYSLPFVDELKFEETKYNRWPIYKTDPVITLVVNLSMYDNKKQTWQCTKLSWTKEHGHDTIAAGFTNGYIALWDLNATSTFLLTVRKNTRFLNAFQHFFAHHNAVTMIALIPYHEKRYLASGGLDEMYKFWDLEETGSAQNCTKKGIIVNGAWMTNWPCAIISFDDALGYKNTYTCVMPLREFGYKYCPILATNTPTYGLAISDYSNSIAHSTLAGEVVTIFPHQLLYKDKVLPKKRQLNSFIKTIDFLEEQLQKNISDKNNKNKNDKNSKDYRYMPETYNECKDRFGIIFHDNLTSLKKKIRRDEKNQDTLYNDKLMSSPIEQYPFTSANRVVWSPNAWSYLWLAVGYQNGLVRLLSLKSMSLS